MYIHTKPISFIAIESRCLMPIYNNNLAVEGNANSVYAIIILMHTRSLKNYRSVASGGTVDSLYTDYGGRILFFDQYRFES